MKPLKRLFQLLVLAIFLAFTIGIPLHKHYCDEKLYSAGLISKDCCCEDSETNPDDCCKTETSIYNIDDHYEITKAGKIKFPATAFDLPNPFQLTGVQPEISEPVLKGAFSTHKPPGKIPLFKLLQEFTFYG